MKTNFNKTSIRLLIKGGLGNQLFQFGAAFSLAKKINAKVLVDDLLLQNFNDESKVAKRPNELTSFHSDLKFLKREKNLLNDLVRKASNLECYFGDRYPGLLSKLGMFSNEYKINPEIFNEINSSVKINSYCNRPDFFNNHRDELVKTISNLKFKSSWFVEIQNEIIRAKPLGIHVRLGDYKNLKNIYGTPDLNYIISAKKLIENLNGLRPIWLFSDEPELAQAIIGNKIKFDHIVNNDKSSQAIEHLLALSTCESIICSNSTFSWWAGYIGTTFHREKLVIFPRPMFSTEEIPEPFNWLPANWLTIGRNI